MNHTAPIRRTDAPAWFSFTDLECREAGENNLRDGFLEKRQLARIELAVADAVGRHGQIILEVRDSLADPHHLPQGDFAKLQMAIPCCSNEHVGREQ